MSAGAMPGGQRELAERFADEFYRNYYSDEIKDLAQHYPQERRSLEIEASDLFQWDRQVLDDWRDRPQLMREIAEEGLRLFDLPIDIELSDANVRLTDTAEALEHRPVADIDTDDIGDYVAVRGQLDKVTAKTPRLDVAVFECQRCGATTEIPQGRSSVQEPHECPSCERDGPYQIDTAASEWTDLRKVKLSEPPERRVTGESGGQSLIVYVEGDLCEQGGEHGLADRSGEIATVLGEYRIDEDDLMGRNASPEADPWLDAHAINFEADSRDDIDAEAHEDDIAALQERDDLIEAYRDSIAPVLMADGKLEDFMEAAVAWLFNGYRIDPDGRGAYRGDLHMGLIGDPGLGKSMLMSALHDLAPKSEFRSGTGLSAVGLTASAVQEEFAGSTEWTLEPGILPRANGGHCLIDEVDAVVGEETKAMHDALEGDQMVKVDKAGIKADLPSRTALLVSGNPTDGAFDQYEPVADQVDLDDALISRLDVLFALQDIPDPDVDADKAEHILDSWDELSRLDLADEIPAVEEPDASKTEPPIPRDVFRAAIKYARENVYPRLTDAAKERLREFYVDVRGLNDFDEDEPVSATPRRLEAGIRLATAFARAEFCDEVKPRHTERAIRISKQVVGLNFDPESGSFDAGRTSKKTPDSQRDRRRALAELIDELADDGAADRETVLDTAAEEMDVDRSKVEHDIEQMLKKGELTEPQTGEVRRT